MPSRSYHLKKKEAPGEGLRRIALGRTGKATGKLDRAGVADDPADAVHGVRKDLKKLRSALRMARRGLGSKLYHDQNETYRDAGRQLSGARDAEVKIETLDGVAGDSGDALPAEVVVRWRALLVAERDEAVRAMDARSLVEPAARIVSGREDLEERSLKLGRSDVLDAVTRSYARGRKAMKRAKADPVPENFHTWRKRAKDLWYQLRIIRKAWPDLLGEMVDRAHELADFLGDHHDLAVLSEDLAGRDFAEADQEKIEEAISRRQEHLAKKAFRLGQRLYAEKPGAFRTRMGSYWDAWR